MIKDPSFFIEKIRALKSELSDKVVIPVHHYQSQEIVSVADIIGDSYKLSVDCSKTDAEYIVFCGVLFMAECADILKKDYQKVVIPAPNAGCPMADMADIKTVQTIYSQIASKSKSEIAPIVYINSYADLKSFCGEHGGSVCTSSNAHIIMEYYLKLGKKVLFFPDANLGINTALKLGVKKDDIISTKNIGSYNEESVILWDGFCPVHLRFSVGDIKLLREGNPNIKIIVHPECPKEITAEADYNGSTEYILNQISNSPVGSVWGVGTETIFVDRLTATFPDKTIIPLKVSECANMKKTTVEILYNTLLNIKESIETGGKVEVKNIVTVQNKYKEGAANALNKMIEIVTKNKVV